jgi:hypothetical protein
MRRLLLWNAQLLDLLTLLWAANLYGGLLGESNPAMRLVYATAGTGGIVVAKVAGVGIFAWAGQRWRNLLTFGIVLGLVGALANLVAIGIFRGAL